MEQMRPLRNLTPASLQRVFVENDNDVAKRDVTDALTSIEGLDYDDAWAYLDELAFRRSWNMSTRIAAFTGLELAKSQTSITN